MSRHPGLPRVRGLGAVLADLRDGVLARETWPGVVLASALVVVGHTATFLVAAAFQLAVIAMRRMVPADELPRALYIFEMIADGVTVLMFALGVFGAIGALAKVEI